MINIDSQQYMSRIAIVVSQYNKIIVDRLVSGCLEKLGESGLGKEQIHLVEVPGAFEIPVVVKKIIATQNPQAVITLGAVIRGETPHFDVIVNSFSMEISRLSTEHTTPIIFGVLTVDNIQQAMDRSGEEESNKGVEAAKTALQMIKVMQTLHVE
jgi:6,7-dimethyl-8-ribityllumazine synthase